MVKLIPVIPPDEATFLLDPENEAEIQQAISRRIKGRTIFFYWKMAGLQGLRHFQLLYFAGIDSLVPLKKSRKPAVRGVTHRPCHSLNFQPGG